MPPTKICIRPELVVPTNTDGPKPESHPEPISRIVEANPSLRVLVVDDNVDFANGLGELLRATGHEVEVVHSGRAALAAMVDFHPDVAVVDIGMPGMDGYEVARRMRQDPDLQGLRVVGVSGYR